MAVPKQKTTKSNKLSRRSHLAKTPTPTMACPKCGELKLNHSVCPKCGSYKDETVIVKKSV